MSYILIERQSLHSKHFNKKQFIHRLVYLKNIFIHLNEVNTSIQKQEMKIIDEYEKLN
jgi:hypothetical protein